MNAPLLKVDGLDLYYGDAQALAGVSLEIAASEIVAIVGANGAGKSSLIRSIHGIETPGRGRVTFDGTDITGWRSHRVCEIGIGHVAEGRQVFPNLTVLENLEMGATPRHARASQAKTLEHVYALFPRLAERRGQAAGTLSGGEQQMLAVARALMLRPRLMLLDEPSFGLAPLIVRDLFGILGKINREEKVTILVVEQNAQLALELADQAYVIETGRIVMSGNAKDIANNEDVRKSYLGY